MKVVIWLLKDIKVPKVVRLHGSETYFQNYS